VAWNRSAAKSTFKLSIDRKNKSGIRPINCPLYHHATSPSFLPMVFALTMIS